MVAPGSAARVLAFHQQPEMLERARHCPDRLGGDTRIERGRVQLGVPKQNLDNADIDILLEQVRSKAVAQRVRADALLDASGLRCFMNSPVELYGEMELLRLLDQFFDRALVFATEGYELYAQLQAGYEACARETQKATR